jgi:hypothetical protein
MARKYQWRTETSIISGGYPGEPVGVIPSDSSWHETSALSGSTTAEYYFHDSDSADNNNASRVVVKIQESWTASISEQNYLTITLNTTVRSIRRDNIVGYPGSIGRNMFIRRQEGGTVLWSVSNDPVATAHTVLGSPLQLDSYTFTLAPGQNLSRGSIYFRSNTAGHDGDTPPSTYVDIMWMGTAFKNTLPIDYCPGATIDGDGVWQSHNRTGGKAHILTALGSWKKMRTDNGLIDSDNPPSIYTNKWYDQRKLGKE